MRNSRKTGRAGKLTPRRARGPRASTQALKSAAPPAPIDTTILGSCSCCARRVESVKAYLDVIKPGVSADTLPHIRIGPEWLNPKPFRFADVERFQTCRIGDVHDNGSGILCVFFKDALKHCRGRVMVLEWTSDTSDVVVRVCDDDLEPSKLSWVFHEFVVKSGHRQSFFDRLNKASASIGSTQRSGPFWLWTSDVAHGDGVNCEDKFRADVSSDKVKALFEEADYLARFGISDW